MVQHRVLDIVTLEEFKDTAGGVHSAHALSDVEQHHEGRNLHAETGSSLQWGAIEVGYNSEDGAVHI